MGGGWVRPAAAAFTFGAAEYIGQEKPFQNVTDEDRPTTGGEGVGRFSPGFSQAGAGIMGNDQSPPEKGTAAAEAAKRALSMGTPIVPQQAETGQTAQEEQLSRRRAAAARESLITPVGAATGSASSQLTGTLG